MLSCVLDAPAMDFMDELDADGFDLCSDDFDQYVLGLDDADEILSDPHQLELLGLDASSLGLGCVISSQGLLDQPMAAMPAPQEQQQAVDIEQVVESMEVVKEPELQMEVEKAAEAAAAPLAPPPPPPPAAEAAPPAPAPASEAQVEDDAEDGEVGELVDCEVVARCDPPAEDTVQDTSPSHGAVATQHRATSYSPARAHSRNPRYRSRSRSRSRSSSRCRLARSMSKSRSRSMSRSRSRSPYGRRAGARWSRSRSRSLSPRRSEKLHSRRSHNRTRSRSPPPTRRSSPAPQRKNAPRPNKARQQQANKASGNDYDTLFVGDLPQHVTSDILRTLFEAFAPLVSARVMGAQCYGFVKFQDPLDAQEVLAKLNREPLRVGGVALRVARAQGEMQQWKRGPAMMRQRAPGQGPEGLEAYENPRARQARLAAAAILQQTGGAILQHMVPQSSRPVLSYDDL